MSLNEPGALYDAAKAPDLQDVPVMAKCDPEAMVWQEQALKTQAVCPNLTPVLTRTGHRYRAAWVRGGSISHKGELQVHVHHHLGVEGRLAAYELVGPTWQLNVINVHIPFGDATATFLKHLMEAYRQLAMMGPTVIIGDFNAAPSAEGDRRLRTQRCKWPYNILACRTSQLLYEASPRTDRRGLAWQIPASTSAVRTRHMSRWHGRNTTTYHPRSPDIDPWRYKSRYFKYPRPPGMAWTTRSNHTSGRQKSTTPANG